MKPSEILIPVSYPNDDPKGGPGQTQSDYDNGEVGDDSLRTVAELQVRKTWAMLCDEGQRRHMAMFVACFVETGKRMGVGSAWRSKEQQQANWERNPQQFSNPATSYHVEVPPVEKAMAVDIVPGDTIPWMHANAARFGLFHLLDNERHHTGLVPLPRSRSTYNRNPAGYWAKVTTMNLPYLGTATVAEWLAADEVIRLDWQPGQPTQPGQPGQPPLYEPGTPAPTLQVGDSGTAAAELIDVMKHWGWYPAEYVGDRNDGKIGQRAVAGIAAMRSALGLTGPAIYDADAAAGYTGMVRALRVAFCPLPPSGQREGSTGRDVAALQTVLADHGWYAYRVDGVYGPRTAQGVQQWQRACAAAGLDPGPVDGVWSDSTRIAACILRGR